MSDRTFRLLRMVVIVIGLQAPMYVLAKSISSDEHAKTALGWLAAALAGGVLTMFKPLLTKVKGETSESS